MLYKVAAAAVVANKHSFSSMDEPTAPLPEAIEASAIYRALRTLTAYFKQSDSKAARELCDKIKTGYVIGPGFLALFNAKAKGEEVERIASFCRKHWTQGLRPLLTDSEFLASLSKEVCATPKDRVTTEDRDEAIQALRQGLAYFDLYFGTGGGNSKN
jgi:hypothetical protein